MQVLNFILFTVFIILPACNEATKNQLKVTSQLTDTIPKVTGIGGIIFLSENPKPLKDWYEKNPGLEIDEYGSVFEFRNANKPDQTNCLLWSPFEKKHELSSSIKKRVYDQL